MEEFKIAIDKFRQETAKEIDTLTQAVAKLTEENVNLRKVYDDAILFATSLLEVKNVVEAKGEKPNEVSTIATDEDVSTIATDEDVRVFLTRERSTADPIILHSIKDRIKYMNHDPQNFSKQLSLIGKKMAEYYRTAHNGKDPSKRDEKINDKHNSPVCVYPEENWEYMDYLIKTSLNLEYPNCNP